MKIGINELNVKKEVLIDNDFEFIASELNAVGIKAIDKAHFTGKVYFNSVDEIVCSGNLVATLILPDAVDLSDYFYDIDIEIEEIIENFENTLDINEVLWENIVLEVPMRVSQSDLGNISGNGWKVKTEEDNDQIDPRLAKLQELYEGGE